MPLSGLAEWLRRWLEMPERLWRQPPRWSETAERYGPRGDFEPLVAAQLAALVDRGPIGGVAVPHDLLQQVFDHLQTLEASWSIDAKVWSAVLALLDRPLEEGLGLALVASRPTPAVLRQLARTDQALSVHLAVATVDVASLYRLARRMLVDDRYTTADLAALIDRFTSAPRLGSVLAASWTASKAKRELVRSRCVELRLCTSALPHLEAIAEARGCPDPATLRLLWSRGIHRPDSGRVRRALVHNPHTPEDVLASLADPPPWQQRSRPDRLTRRLAQQALAARLAANEGP